MDGGSIHLQARRLTAAGAELRDEVVAEEVAVALVYNGISHAVMMATPCDLEDFARGFSLTEHIVEKPSEIYDIEVEDRGTAFGGRGIEVNLQIANQRMAVLQERRRSMSGRTGCGLCGVDSLEAALRPVPATRATATVSRAAITRAMAALPGEQRINKDNGATHAAGWARADGSLLLVREDVGRHNALDKLAGALAKMDRGGPGERDGGFVVVTSRCSYEMVQKAAAIDAAAIAAVSAPTSLAIATAEQAGLALVAFVRDNRLTVYAHGERIEA
ncbi:MAG: formate dehydrogenase accessory sulfurtransferase FdhD [Reyranella sp.]|uniref:formate dehydrogenase accessory sulfurtransferase FdhD n=1 Tax=Reyranella sp. TaxID=1929291 RepID=UPI001AC89024|nr:formate dehydrogenase accessory sulfurtransferase FdhD [Reyranella sp.]MBN9088262.1 formate dehydrogenase accessory sulfurtransferase FdhD [Reyranella sp.]